MNRNSRARFVLALWMAVLAVLSCRSGEATGPTRIAALPVDSLPHLTINLPLGRMMTSGTTEQIAIAAVNLEPQSCRITAPDWLGLKAGADSNAVWTVAPTSSGAAVLITRCTDFRNSIVRASDTLAVYRKPSVIPDISGVVPVDVGDSIVVSYDSTDTPKVDVACSHCDSFANLTHVASNTLRLLARDVPSAIRASEIVPLHTIPVATYDLTGQSNHPDFMRVHAPWAGGACYMVFTPYFGSNGFVENPSLATSPDCEHWSPAAGVKAPLIDKPVDGYNSDPELMYDAPRGCLGVVFRQVISKNSVNVTSTCDGKTWSTPRLLFTAPNHSAVSPTVTQGPDGFNRIWYVDAGAAGCMNQSNVVKMRVATSDTAGLGTIQFSAEVPTDLAQPGSVIWHMKVRYVAALKQYVAMYAAFPATSGIGNCMNDDLFMATSADGVHWQSFLAPVINRLDKRFKFTSMYRASFQYDANTDELRTIVSGLEASNWGQYGVVHGYTALVSALNSSFTVAASQLIPSSKLVRKPDMGMTQVIMEDQLFNADAWVLEQTIGTSTVANNANGFEFTTGSVTVSAIPVLYSGLTIGSASVNFGTAACDLSGAVQRTLALTAPTAGAFAWTATFPFTASVKAGTSADAGTVNGYEYDAACATNAAGGEGATIAASQYTTMNPGPTALALGVTPPVVRLDNASAVGAHRQFVLAGRDRAAKPIGSLSDGDLDKVSGGAMLRCTVGANPPRGRGEQLHLQGCVRSENERIHERSARQEDEPSQHPYTWIQPL